MSFFSVQIRTILSKSAYKRYEKLLLSRALSEMSDIVDCPGKDCKASVILDSPDLGRCPDCSLTFCPICRTTYHAKESCNPKYIEIGKHSLASICTEAVDTYHAPSCSLYCLLVLENILFAKT